MDRRSFMGMLAGSALSGAIDPPGFSWAQATTPSATEKALDWRVTHQLMDDYTVSKPYKTGQFNDALHVGEDGTLNIYSLMVNADGTVLLTRLFTDQQSPSGWSSQRITLPKDDRPGGPKPRPPIPIVCSALKQLQVYRDSYTQLVTLDPYGALDGIGRKVPFPTSGVRHDFDPFRLDGMVTPLLRGALADGVRFYPALVTNPASGTVFVVGEPGGWSLVDGITMAPPSVQPSALPLKSPDYGSARYLLREANGDVSDTTFQLRGGRFVVAQRRVLGRLGGRGGSMVLFENGDDLDVLLVEPPAIRSFALRNGTWQEGKPATVPGWTAVPRNRALLTYGIKNSATGLPQLLAVTVKPFTDCDHVLENVMEGLDPNSDPFEHVSAAFTALRYRQDPQALADAVAECRASSLVSPELWTTAKQPDGSWDTILQIDEGGWPLAPIPQLTDAFVQFRPSSGFEVWRQSIARDFLTEHVRLLAEFDARPPMSAAHRVGLTVTQDGAPLVGEKLRITTSTACIGEYQGRHVVLSRGNSMVATLDAEGTAWLTILTEDDLLAPSVAFRLDRVPDVLTCPLDGAMREFLGSLQPTALANATDPETGKRVLPHAEDAEAVTQAIASLIKAAPGDPPDPPGFFSRARPAGTLPARFAASPAAAFAPGPPPPNSGAWRLYGASGSLKFEPLQPGAIRAMTGTGGGVQPMVIWDPRDWPRHIKEIGEAAWDFLVENGTAALRIVVNGVRYAVTFVLDTIDRVFDAIDWVLDKAGVLVGMACNWILKQLGFLIDWEAILEKRTELKKLLETRAPLAMAAFGNPATQLQSVKDRLDTVKADLLAHLAAYRSQPAIQKPLDTTTSSLGPWQGLLQLSPSSSILPRITGWVDKLLAALPGGSFFPDLGTLAGFDTAVQDLFTVIDRVSARFARLVSELVKLVAEGLADPVKFLAHPIDAFIDIFARQIDAVFDVVREILVPVGKVLEAIWNSPVTVLRWLDTKVQIPFFSGFYRGLAESDLSVLDFICLMAAFPARARERRRGPIAAMTGGVTAAADSQRDENLHTAGLSFMIIGCVTTAASSFLGALLPDMLPAAMEPLKFFGWVFTGADIACTVGSMLCFAWENDSVGEAIATSTAIGIVGLIVAAKYRGYSAVNRGRMLSVINILQAYYNLARFIGAYGLGNDKGTVFNGLSTVQNCLKAGLGVYKNDKGFLSPQAALGYAALQGALSGGKTAAFDLM